MTQDERNVILDALRMLGLAILADGAAPWDGYRDGTLATERNYMDSLLRAHHSVLMAEA